MSLFFLFVRQQDRQPVLLYLFVLITPHVCTTTLTEDTNYVISRLSHNHSPQVQIDTAAPLHFLLFFQFNQL